jgi:hypothetical protein
LRVHIKYPNSEFLVPTDIIENILTKYLLIEDCSDVSKQLQSISCESLSNWIQYYTETLTAEKYNMVLMAVIYASMKAASQHFELLDHFWFEFAGDS